MNVEEIETELNERVAGIVDDLVAKRLTELVDSSSKELDRVIAESDAVRIAIRKHFDTSVAADVGNRLRCGIYNGTQVDELFKKVWTKQLDIAIEDRIRIRVLKAIDKIIDEKLSSLKTNGGH